VSGVFGLGLLALAIPRVSLEGYLLTASPGLEALEAGDPVPGDEAAAYARNLSAVARGSGSPQAYALAARAWIAVAKGPGRTDSADALAQAQSIQAEGLARAPADQYGWQRLAYTLSLHNDWIAAAHAWGMAMRTGPFEPSLMGVKFRSGLALWRYMDLDERARFAGLAETFLQTQRQEMLDQVRRFDAAATVRQALANRPSAAIFDHALTESR
jgi:hypothetical protein